MLFQTDSGGGDRPAVHLSEKRDSEESRGHSRPIGPHPQFEARCPHAWGVAGRRRLPPGCRNLDPRPPYGGRCWTTVASSRVPQFRSAPPIRGATAKTAKTPGCFCSKIDVSFKYPLPISIQSKKQGSLLTENTARSGAKLQRSSVCLHFAPKASAHLSGHRMPLPQNARSCSRNGPPSSKSADYPFPGP